MTPVKLIRKGRTVRTPDGSKGRVTSVNVERKATRGRPPTVAVVGGRVYRASELQPVRA